MDFSTQNSARKIVQDKPHWKSRPLDLGNRHRTTLNFGDLVPAFWQHVEPGDKLKMDATILAKFMPLLAPAFSRMKIKSEWFYVPLKQISPPSLRALQDFEPADASTAFNELLQTGKFGYTSLMSEDQQFPFLNGFPSLPAYMFSKFFASATSTVFKTVNSEFGPWVSSSDSAYNGSSLTGLTHWRTQGTINSGDVHDVVSKLGLEDFNCFASMNRCRKFLNYLGLPKRLTTMRYTTDVVACQGNQDGVISSYQGLKWINSSDSATIDTYTPTSSERPWMSDVYRQLVFNETEMSIPSDGVVGVSPWTYPNSFWLNDFSVHNGVFTFDSNYRLASYPTLTCGSNDLISLLPSQAYQKIYNDFYRDEKLQPEEVRLYPYAVWSSSSRALLDALHPATVPLCVDSPYTQHNISGIGVNGSPATSLVRIMNNLCQLRRRNRAKDVFSSCVSNKVLVNRLAGSSTAPNVFQSNLFSKVEKYLMKKEFTGSTWAEWLSNFFGENSNDYLNNNVIFLGAKESIVSISENIQTSEGNENSPQGNRAGLAGDFHSGDSIYFRVPDFGIVMCIVSVIPDDLDNFNGLQERFERYSPYQFNLPDLQNIGFSPIFNRRANVSWFDYNSYVGTTSQVTDMMYDGSKVFGYQPFGYQHTYTPNLVTGDFQTSLRYWHQSSDLDYDFTNWQLAESSSNWLQLMMSWKNGQLSLNSNLPAIGLRQQPLGSDLAAQYYNNVFASLNDESGDHIVADMRFFVNCHRKTAFFTDAIGCDD